MARAGYVLGEGLPLCLAMQLPRRARWRFSSIGGFIHFYFVNSVFSCWNYDKCLNNELFMSLEIKLDVL